MLLNGTTGIRKEELKTMHCMCYQVQAVVFEMCRMLRVAVDIYLARWRVISVQQRNTLAYWSIELTYIEFKSYCNIIDIWTQFESLKWYLMLWYLCINMVVRSLTNVRFLWYLFKSSRSWWSAYYKLEAQKQKEKCSTSCCPFVPGGVFPFMVY